MRRLPVQLVLTASALLACSHSATDPVQGPDPSRPPTGVLAVAPVVPAPGAGTPPSAVGVTAAAPSANSAPVPVPDQGMADFDPENDYVVAPPAPLPDCDARLTTAGVQFEPSAFPLKQKRGDTFTCGAEQVVLYKQGPQQIRFSPHPQLTCRMAIGLARFEAIAQELAQQYLGSRIRKITQIGTYNCRKMARFQDMVSEHSYGNAIDLQSFQLENWKTISVLKDFGPLDQAPVTPEALFLHALANRLFDDGAFSVVLTPYFDANHKDHFHLDQARYRLDGSRR